jgi:WD40 repeat protein
VGKSPAQAAAEQKTAAKKAVEGREPLTLKGHSIFVSSVSFSPDGKRIVSGGRDGTVKVWDLSSLDTSP